MAKIKSELEAAYESLTKADRQIKNLLLERHQLNMVIDLLEAGNFIACGKLDEAREFVRDFKSQ